MNKASAIPEERPFRAASSSYVAGPLTKVLDVVGARPVEASVPHVPPTVSGPDAEEQAFRPETGVPPSSSLAETTGKPARVAELPTVLAPIRVTVQAATRVARPEAAAPVAQAAPGPPTGIVAKGRRLIPPAATTTCAIRTAP